MQKVPLNDNDPIWLTCPDCGSDCRDRTLQPGEALRCGKCGARIKKYGALRSLETIWAFASAGLIFSVLANFDSVLTFSIMGNTQSNRIITGVRGLITQDYSPVAAMVFFGAIVGPILHFASVWYVAGACCSGRRWPMIRGMFQVTTWLEPWNLIPVYAVGILVAVVKLGQLGDVAWRRGSLWVVLMSLCFLFIVQLYDRHMVETRIKELQ